MTLACLRPLRDVLTERGEELTFADLSEPLLEDLAVGWEEGRPIAIAAAEMLSQIDGIPIKRRSRQVAGRALLTLLVRQGAPLSLAVQGDEMRLLGSPALDQGDAEAEAAWHRREEEYQSLSELECDYPLEKFTVDVATAFEATRSAVSTDVDLPPDAVAESHRLALLYRAAPKNLRVWFHRRYRDVNADAICWKFILAGRALTRYRTIALPGEKPAGRIPKQLMASVLAIDLGDLARTSILEP